VILGESNKATATTTITNKDTTTLVGACTATTGTNDTSIGVYGTSTNGYGVRGDSEGLYAGVGGYATGAGASGVYGEGSGGGGYGLYGDGTEYGVYGNVNSSGFGVYGNATENDATGVYGNAAGEGGTGVYGNATGEDGWGVFGGAYGSEGVGVYAEQGSSATTALYVYGNATVNGTLSKAGGSFQIDHPLDPARKYLYHSFVESPDMMNVYNGTVVLDRKGQATVELPDWFEALNRDYRYTLTALDEPAPDLHISSRVKDGKFSIAGGKAGQEVSWQVTGIRQDAFANAHRIPVEVDKPAHDQGRYLHPELFGEGDEHVITAVAKARSHGSRRASTVA
jgi:hypothetical protein